MILTYIFFQISASQKNSKTMLRDTNASLLSNSLHLIGLSLTAVTGCQCDIRLVAPTQEASGLSNSRLTPLGLLVSNHWVDATTRGKWVGTEVWASIFQREYWRMGVDDILQLGCDRISKVVWNCCQVSMRL